MISHRRKGYKAARKMPKIYNTVSKPKRSFVGFWRLLRNLFVILIIGAATYYFLISGIFKVKKVTVEGSFLSDKSRLQKSVSLNSNIFFINKRSLITKLESDPAIINVNVLKGLPDEIRIVVQEKEPALFWQSGDCVYLIDGTGRAFAKLPNEQFNGLLTENADRLGLIAQVVDAKSLPVELGQNIVSPSFISFVNEAKSQISDLLPDLKVSRIEIVDTTYQVTFFSDKGMQVLFNTLADPGVQVRNLTRLVQQKKVSPNSRVDLRINRWAYVS